MKSWVAKMLRPKPTVAKTGTSDLIKRYKKLVSKKKAPLDKKVTAAKLIHKFSREHGMTKTDIEVGKRLKD